MSHITTDKDGCHKPQLDPSSLHRRPYRLPYPSWDHSAPVFWEFWPEEAFTRIIVTDNSSHVVLNFQKVYRRCYRTVLLVRDLSGGKPPRVVRTSRQSTPDQSPVGFAVIGLGPRKDWEQYLLISQNRNFLLIFCNFGQSFSWKSKI